MASCLTTALTVGCQDAAGNMATTQLHVLVTLPPPGLFGFLGF